MFINLHYKPFSYPSLFLIVQNEKKNIDMPTVNSFANCKQLRRRLLLVTLKALIRDLHIAVH